MTEDEARQVLLLQSREDPAARAAGTGTGEAAAATAGTHGDGTPLTWRPEDRAWATQQAVAALGPQATPERFVVMRAGLALQRLLPRDAGARRWMGQRLWHPAWVIVAAALGLGLGLLADQLGPPQRVNVMAPAVWAVLLWNVAVYATMALSAWRPLPAGALPAPPGLRRLLHRLAGRGDAAAGALWTRHGGPLLLQRGALLAHVAAGALGAALVAGLYGRGLVLDYRAGWQSTFLEAHQVQALLDALLAPAAWLTGIAVPDVAPLRVGPAQDAVASAAPWIHLYAAMLALVVLLPRGLLALRAGLSAARLARRLPLPLDRLYFESLHPLMRPDLPPELRLLWPAANPVARLHDTAITPAALPLDLLRSAEGDALCLVPGPADAALAAAPGASGAARPWWRPWGDAAPAEAPLRALRRQVDAVLWVAQPGQALPAWLAALDQPVVVLVAAGTAPGGWGGAAEGGTAVGWVGDAAIGGWAGLPAAAVALTCRLGEPAPAYSDGPGGQGGPGPRGGSAGSAGPVGPATAPVPVHPVLWLAGGPLLAALHQLLPDDPRLARLRSAWRARAAARRDALAAALAETLAELACQREAVADGAVRRRPEDLAAARQALAARWEAAWQAHRQRMRALGVPLPEPGAAATAAGAAAAAMPHAEARLNAGDGPAALPAPASTGPVDGRLDGRPDGPRGAPPDGPPEGQPGGRLDRAVDGRAHGAASAPSPAGAGAQAAGEAGASAAGAEPTASPAARGGLGAALRNRIGEGRAALVGGVLSGALAGLKADALSGGLTMGAGALTGGLLGALGAAGAARGANALRGTDRSYLEWPDATLHAAADEALRQLAPAVAESAPHQLPLRLAQALPAWQPAWQAALDARPTGADIAGHAPELAAALRPALASALQALAEDVPGR